MEAFTFEGVQAVDEATLRETLVTRESGWLPWGETRYFDRDEFEEDLKRIESFYRDRGYPNAEVLSYDIDLQEQGHRVRLRVAIWISRCATS